MREAPPKDLPLRSGSQRAAALAAPAGHDGPPGAGTHPQPEAMHAGSAPVVRLEGPLALGHGVLLVISGMPSGRSRFREASGGESCCWPARSPGDEALVAAVSPTFGRLFEGTDEPSLGQTWSAATQPTHTSAENAHSRRRRCGTIAGAKDAQPQGTLKKPIGMQQNGWQPNGKLLASGNAVSEWSGARRQSEDGGSTSCLGDLNGWPPARRSRAVAGRLRLVYHHPVHTCV